MVGVVVLLAVIAIGLSSRGGGGQKPPQRSSTPPPIRTQPTFDPEVEGRSRGYHWKSVMKNRRAAFTRDGVQMVADRMASDYRQLRGNPEGKKLFVRGFEGAVFGN